MIDEDDFWSNWWNEDWQGKPKYSKKTCPSATFSTTNPTWPDPGSKPDRRGGKPATNRLSYGAAFSVRSLILIFMVSQEDFTLYIRNGSVKSCNAIRTLHLRLQGGVKTLAWTALDVRKMGCNDGRRWTPSRDCHMTWVRISGSEPWGSRKLRLPQSKQYKKSLKHGHQCDISIKYFIVKKYFGNLIQVNWFYVQNIVCCLSLAASARQLTQIHDLKDHGLMSFPIKRFTHYVYLYSPVPQPIWQHESTRIESK
jgi:hypothetical protein